MLVIWDGTQSLPRHDKRVWKQRTLDDITEIVIHHSASNKSLEELNEYHVGPNHISDKGMPHIAYHYAISFHGDVFKLNELTDITWHAGNVNGRSIGVLVMGNFHANKKQEP